MIGSRYHVARTIQPIIVLKCCVGLDELKGWSEVCLIRDPSGARWLNRDTRQTPGIKMKSNHSLRERVSECSCRRAGALKCWCLRPRNINVNVICWCSLSQVCLGTKAAGLGCVHATHHFILQKFTWKFAKHLKAFGSLWFKLGSYCCMLYVLALKYST